MNNMLLNRFHALTQSDITSLISGTREKIDKTVQDGGLLNTELLRTEKLTITVWDLVVIGIIIVATALVLKLIKKAIVRNSHIDAGKQYSLYSLTKYFIVTVAFVWILQSLGIRLTLLLGGSAALLVGVGMGLQNLFSDFVSGIILLVDSSIKVGDVVDVNGLVCEVKQINLRTTQVLTRDDKFILLPNSQLTKNNIINWTHNIDASRFDVSVGAGYDSDPELVKRLLLEVAASHAEVLDNPKPFVRFNDFGDSALTFKLYFWCKNMFRVENIKSDLRFRIFKKFNENNIEIPLPQRVVHYYADERETDLAHRSGDISSGK